MLAIGNDPNSLVYLGVLYKKTPQTPADNKYLDTYGVYRKDGQFLGIDKIARIFKMLFDGDIEVDKVHNIKINVTDAVTVICNQANITSDGATNVTANGNLTVTAPTSTFNGNIQCTGNIVANGEVGAMSGAVQLSTHIHPYTDTQPNGSQVTKNTSTGVG